MSYNIIINYEIASDATSPMLLTKYVKELDTNPKTIEEGGTATLGFVADGLYYTLQKAKALAVKVTGASSTWSCAAPYTYGSLVLSNPTSDVTVSIKAKVNIVPQQLSRPFLVQKPFAIDTRMVLSKAEMRDIDDAGMPDTYFALCKEDGHFYVYYKEAEINEETGKYSLVTDTPKDLGLPDSFLLQDPTGDQVIIYDAELQKWVNKDLADKESIIYLAERGLTIKGYEDATQGQMLVKDNEKGLVWTTPLTTADLQTHVAAAYDSAQRAGQSAVEAGNEAIRAEAAASTAQYINDTMISYVENKFWWGTIEEYNALDHINAGTFHFITLESTDVEE